MAGRASRGPASPTSPKLRARVLLDHDGFKIDDIVEGADAERGQREGWADAHPDAVAHARKIASRRAREKADAVN